MLPSELMVIPRSVLLQGWGKGMFGAEVLQQVESVLMSMSHVTTKGYAEVHGLGYRLMLC